MRDIKFRFWDTVEQEMIYDLLLTTSGGVEMGIIYTFDVHIPMQYIGRKDKNGVEIYEEDVCRFKDIFHGRTQIGTMKYDLDSWGYKLVDLSRDDDWLLHPDNTEYIEVIGNVYENPELLEEE